MSNTKATLFWFRQDLRLFDNPGLYEAAQNGKVLAVYIRDEAPAGDFKTGAASQCWLHHSLQNLDHDLDKQLNVYQGNAKDILLQLIQQYKIDNVFWNRCYEPWRVKEDAEIKSHLKSLGINCESFNSALLWEPWQVLKSDKTPYKVFTPFYKRGCLQAPPPRQPLPKPKQLALIKDKTNLTTINDLHLLPALNWHEQMIAHWQVGETAAQNKLEQFLEDDLAGYKEGRNFPSQDHTSRLSPHLHFGEISPHQIWYEALNKPMTNDLENFLSEIGWREFSYSLLYHFPDLPRENFQAKFNYFPWQKNLALLKAWQTGQTGYPIVDAGMRELWQTGYMHNRVRMIVGSFLVKNLLLHWHHGEDWFWNCLVDADLANNSASWQWIAGSGADAAPYFRIFNPVTQGEKFDVDGEYTRKYVPELKNLPSKYLFKPWEAPAAILKQAGVILGENYPQPIVSIPESRAKALAGFASLPKGTHSV